MILPALSKAMSYIHCSEECISVVTLPSDPNGVEVATSEPCDDLTSYSSMSSPPSPAGVSQLTFTTWPSAYVAVTFLGISGTRLGRCANPYPQISLGIESPLAKALSFR